MRKKNNKNYKRQSVPLTTLKIYNKINTEEVTQNKYIALQRIIKNKNKKVQKSKGRREIWKK